MGACDSINESRIKKLSKNSFLKESEAHSYFSSSSLPIISPSVFTQKLPISKKHKSIDKLNPLNDKKFILPQSIAKREDITHKYTISKILGDGATAQVFLGENSSKQKFAIKRIKKDKIDNSIINNIIKETSICFKLKNKNVIEYYEIYEDISSINIVMEYCNIDLFELMMSCPFGHIPEGLAIDFLIQIFESIDYLHNTLNIVHCDIKPENYVLKFDKQNIDKQVLKLIDFGNIRHKPINKGRLYHFSGTREYMAPETMENYGFNEKVDEWAAGVIMFNMLTGCDPFSSDSDSQYEENIKFKEIKFEYIKNKSLRELNKKLLNRNIDERITAKEALEEIKNIQKNLKSNFSLNVLKNTKENEKKWNNVKNKLSFY